MVYVMMIPPLFIIWFTRLETIEPFFFGYESCGTNFFMCANTLTITIVIAIQIDIYGKYVNILLKSTFTKCWWQLKIYQQKPGNNKFILISWQRNRSHIKDGFVIIKLQVYNNTYPELYVINCVQLVKYILYYINLNWPSKIN